MINEKREVEMYLNGEGVNKNILYRICYLLAKHYKEEGMSRLDTRTALFDWANAHQIYVQYDLNSIINFVYDVDKRTLSDTEYVLFSSEDVAEINKRFDEHNVKLVAFALLAYAKRFANAKNEIVMGYHELANWVGIGESVVRKRIIKQLIDYEMVAIVKADKSLFKKHDKLLSSRTRFKILIPVKDEGETKVGNDIRGGFAKLFR